MSAKLRQFPTSACGAMVRKLLHYKGLEFDVDDVDILASKEQLLTSVELFIPQVTLTDGETIAASERIALRLEELYPEPTILAPDQRGIQIALERYIQNDAGTVLLRLAIPGLVAYFRRLGAEHEAAFRQIVDENFGAGFCARAEGERDAITAHAAHLLEPFEDALAGKAFLMGRIGLADFALYGQLYSLALSGELNLPREFPNLRAFHGRIDRISASLEDV
jgi:glutathione S-transferase